MNGNVYQEICDLFMIKLIQSHGLVTNWLQQKAYLAHMCCTASIHITSACYYEFSDLAAQSLCVSQSEWLQLQTELSCLRPKQYTRGRRDEVCKQTKKYVLILNGKPTTWEAYISSVEVKWPQKVCHPPLLSSDSCLGLIRSTCRPVMPSVPRSMTPLRAPSLRWLWSMMLALALLDLSMKSFRAKSLSSSDSVIPWKKSHDNGSTSFIQV